MRWLSLFIAIFLASCSCSSNGAKRGVVRIGVDPTWSPLSFDELQPYVNGFTEDFLLDFSKYSGMEVVKVAANWDNLLDGLREGQYDAVLCSLPPYNFNMAKYEFSKNYLELGPVLITPSNAHFTDLDQMNGELVGVISGDPAVLVVQKYPEVIIRNYNSIPDVLNAVASGDIEAAVLDRLPASNYVRDFYAGKLKIAASPMSEVGLHAVTLKGKSDRFLRLFNQNLEQMQKKKSLDSLQKKWSL